MGQDMVKGRRTEIEFLNGFIVDFTPNKRVGSNFVELSFIQPGGRFVQ